MTQKTICGYLGRSCVHDHELYRLNPTLHDSLSVRTRRVASQGRLCVSLGLRKQCTHELSFLDLPRTVRARIYDLAGIPRDKEIELPSRRPCNTGVQFKFDFLDVFEPLMLNLLLTSRKVYREILERIYSRNRFIIHCPDRSSLGALRNLNVEALMAIRYLGIDLLGIGRDAGVRRSTTTSLYYLLTSTDPTTSARTLPRLDQNG
jgi:hypothetical protein